MSYQLTRQKIGNEVYFNHVSDEKFKHNRITVNFIVPMEKNNVTDNAVVPFILRKGYQNCPDFSKLNAKLCDLYGARLDADVGKYGENQILEVSLYALDNRYTINKEDIVSKCARMLCEIVTTPNLVNRAFTKEDTNLEKQFLIDTIESEINEKRTYAILKCMELMFKGEGAGIKKYGYTEEAEKITPQSATNSYYNLLKTARIEIMMVGAGDAQSAVKIFKDSFANIERTPCKTMDYSFGSTAHELKEHTEIMEVSQSKLVMGFRVNDVSTYEDICKVKVFSALFGGTPFSKLFTNVREKLSLCYYCASRFDRSTGVVLVDSGIEAQNKEKAQKEIINQLNAICSGDFTDEELANTKLIIKNGLAQITDSLSAIENWYLTQILYGTQIAPDEDGVNYDTITKEDIIEVAKKIKLDTVYFLTTKGE